MLVWLGGCGTSRVEHGEDGSSEAGGGGRGQEQPLCPGPAPDLVERLPPLEFSHYHGGSEITEYLARVASTLPEFVTHRVLGTSSQGRNLDVLTVDFTCTDHPKSVFLNGAHHGDEPASAEVVLGAIDGLLRSQEPEVLDALTQYRFLFMPVVNPDGLAAGTRADCNGLDLNRDYDYPGRSTEAFSAPETQAVRELSITEGVYAALAFHSGMVGVLWPYCHTTEPTADDRVFGSLAGRVAVGLGTTTALQSAEDYISYGEYIDYAYAVHGTLALTVEVAGEKSPEPTELTGIVEVSWYSLRQFLEGLVALEAGQLLPALPRGVTGEARSPRDHTGRLE